MRSDKYRVPRSEHRMPSVSSSLRHFAFIAIVVLTWCSGCSMQRTVLEQSVVDSYPDPMDELDFLDELEAKRVVTNNDALHALLLITNDVQEPEDFESRLERARRRGWVSERDELHPNESVRLGTVAVAVCDILEIKGGLTMHVLGPSKRYATRELVYLQMIPRRTENQSLTGLEFIELMSRVEAWQASKAPVRDPETIAAIVSERDVVTPVVDEPVAGEREAEPEPQTDDDSPPTEPEAGK